MEKKHIRSILGFILSPLICLFIYFLFIVAESIISLIFNIKHAQDTSLSTVLSWMIFPGIPFMYIFTIIIGVPTIVLLKKTRFFKFLGFLYSGIFWGILAFIILLSKILDMPLYGIIIVFISIEIVSIGSFLSYWWIAKAGNK